MDRPVNGSWDLAKGHLYRIRSRNFPYGVYDGNGGFIGIREKFGELYLFTEYDYDQGPPYGTVRVDEDLGPIPGEIEPAEEISGEGSFSGRRTANGALYHFLAVAEHRHGQVLGFGRRPKAE